MRNSIAVFRHRGAKMVGVLSRPQGPKGRRFPAVLLLHGFPGSEKNVDVQRALMGRGIAGFAPHSSGTWGSGGLYRFSTLVDQARAGLRVLARQPWVDARRMAVFGASMGGWTAIHLGRRVPALRAVVAVSPVGGPEMVTPEAFDFIERNGPTLRVASLAALRRDFVKTVRAGDPARSAARMKPPLLLIHGTADDIVPFSVSERIHAAAPGKSRLVTAPGADHGFLDRRPWLVGRVVRCLARRLMPAASPRGAA
ncbi:MAG: prolyl oligopeptidase family serine peptidase [Elusimicrobiota bacterium]